MATRELQTDHTIGRHKVRIDGRFTTNGAGAVGTTTQQGHGFTITKPGATTGVYRINLGPSTTYPDKYESLVAASAIVLNNAATRYQIQAKVFDVSAAAPYVDFLVYTQATTGTIAVVDPGITVTPVTSTAYADELRNVALYGGTFAHADATGMAEIASPDANDLPSLKTLCQEICVRMQAHDDDIVAHKHADTGNLAVAAWASSPNVPADLAECEAILIEVKGEWNTHVAKINVAANADVHFGYAPNQLCVEPNAVDQATSEVLANEIKGRYNVARVSTYRDAAATVAVMTSATAAHAAATTATLTPTTAATAADLVSCEVHFTLVLATSGVD
jgi:hypothetical protein